jgi:hypothetical protein
MAEPTPAELRRELRELLGSWDYAFAMGARRSYGSDPRLDGVLQRVAELRAQLAAGDEERRPRPG